MLGHTTKQQITSAVKQYKEENERLEAENAELRERVAELQESGDLLHTCAVRVMVSSEPSYGAIHELEVAINQYSKVRKQALTEKLEDR